ncbi:acyltransferase family protein [Bergeyella zoohelcum]|uniref:Fucose 4-O-acetylase and related acetyltransferases n=1 Tax=Bergeyella zoohelcum TaxID=1015 RepID=A0A376BZG3_9FLAO|nr:acyltransferase family protein [Bergeyella zoohelcum]EKB60876.1 hypothetical protein HMPREF9700_00371 [Bergeyella zoohelcum CCUG 30536]SSZ47032.1 Fucose 4-O-acetylase and related acetyltransferases [Bergeyella zoohelcum]
MKRDLYIDFAKGFATISVIFIHSAFFSGQLYVPSEVRSLSLLFDVVLFYALSGITSGGNLDKTFYRLIKLQITYMLFVTLIFFLDYFIKVIGLSFYTIDELKEFYKIFGEKYVPQSISTYPQWQNLGNWYLHNYVKADSFPVIMGSFWYLKVYFILAILGALILRFFPKHVHCFIALCFGLTLFFYFFPAYYPTGHVGYVSTYLGVFLLGNQLKGKKLSPITIGMAFTIAAIALAWAIQHYGLNYHLNKNKFPPKLPYIIWISFSVILLFSLYNRWKIKNQSIFTFIGNNAIFFYFSQGISSTMIYFLVDALKENMHWSVLLPIAFLTNVLLAILIAIALKKYDAIGWKILEFLRQKTSKS